MNPKTKAWLEFEQVERGPREERQPVVHLFIKGENRVVCCPTTNIGAKTATIYPSKVTCRNCINRILRKKKAERK